MTHWTEYDAADRDELLKYQQEALMAAKIGPSYGFRRTPQVRHVAGDRSWWVWLVKHRTERAARRTARHMRNSGKYPGRTFGVYEEPRKPGRRTSDWWVCAMKTRTGT